MEKLRELFSKKDSCWELIETWWVSGTQLGYQGSREGLYMNVEAKLGNVSSAVRNDTNPCHRLRREMQASLPAAGTIVLQILVQQVSGLCTNFVLGANLAIGLHLNRRLGMHGFAATSCFVGSSCLAHKRIFLFAVGAQSDWTRNPARAGMVGGQRQRNAG